jgi:hypothetical protein
MTHQWVLLVARCVADQPARFLRCPDKATVKDGWRRLPKSAPPAETTLQPKTGLIMPRYFFNTRIGSEVIADPEGEELRSPDRAWEVARAMIHELLRIEGVENLMRAVLEVTDDEGEIVLEFPFAEAVLDDTDAEDGDMPVTKH